jgi:hypothetical protein
LVRSRYRPSRDRNFQPRQLVQIGGPGATDQQLKTVGRSALQLVERQHRLLDSR